MTKKLESPCKKCEQSPCPRPQDCQEKWEYVEKLGSGGVPAVDMDQDYRLLPK